MNWSFQFGFISFSPLLIAVGEWLPFMHAVQRFYGAHPSLNRTLVGVTVAMTGLGVLLPAFTQFLVRVPDPHRAHSFKTEGTVKGPGRFFFGRMMSAGFSDEARVWRLKKAFREGEWWSVLRWRRFTLMMLGAILTFYGLFGLLFCCRPLG